jgi:hypothetical protein
MNTRLRILAALPLLAFFSATVRAALPITEDFTGYSTGAVPSSGTSSFLADPGFGGTSSGAWLTGWRSALSNVTASGLVSASSPLNGGGNHLTASLKASSSSTALNSGAIGRSYAAVANSLTTTTHAISFDFRLDALPSTMSFDIYDASSRSNAANASTAWQFSSNGGVWSYRNGASTEVTTMTVDVGTTYSFSINVNPVTFKYDFSISNGTTSVSASAVSFRNNSFATDTSVGFEGGRWLEFGAAETSDVFNQIATYSVDNFSIGAIPEPSTYALLTGTSLLGFAFFRRRRLSR